MPKKIRFKVGQPIRHKIFNYRGVVAEVDPTFQQTTIWYETMTTDSPPKDEPWYSVLVHDSPCIAYVSQQNLEPDLTGAYIKHPAMSNYFKNLKLENGLYLKK